MNILFITSDSLVPFVTGPYGDQAGATPNLDALAAAGTVFDNAYCNSPLCASSRASLMTGRYVADFGAFDNATEFSAEWPTIPYALRAAGYDTTAIGKLHYAGHDQWHGFNRRIAWESDYLTGFNIKDAYQLAWSWEKPARGNPVGVDWMGPSYVNSEKWDHYPHHYDADEDIHEKALAYLGGKRRDDAPFFCCVSYHAPHNPFWIPEKFKTPFRGKDLPIPQVPEGVDTCHGPMDFWLNTFHYVPEVHDAMMQPENLRWLYETYYGMVYDLDLRIGELLQTLQTNGLAEDTAIVFASDHGDMLGQRGMLQKRYFYEWSIRVPLIVVLPGGQPQQRHVSELVSLVDLFPTFAEMTQAPLPQDLPGRSLLPPMTTGAPREDRPVFCEYHGEGVLAPCFSMRSGNFKYVYVHGHEERLYNVAEDPDEYENLITAPGCPEIAAGMKQTLLSQFDPNQVARDALTSQRNRAFLLDCMQRNP